MPAEFADIAAQQVLVVDLYFQNRRVGEAQVLATPQAISFLEPELVAALLAGVKVPGQLAKALMAPLPAVSAARCDRAAGEPCPEVQSQAVRARFDRDRFRVDLFVAPALLSIASPVEPAYISPPSKALSLVSALSGTVYGSAGTDSALALQNRVIVARGRERLASDLYFDSKRGLQVDQARAEADIADLRISAGLLYSTGTDLIARRRLLGLAVATQLDTRRDRELLQGTPVVLTLGQRAKVDILQDGRVLSSRVYDAGNQWLDTSQLPGGSYDIVLRIAEAGQPVREERRFFVRSQKIAQLGHDILFLTAGVLAPQFARRSLSISQEPHFEAGYAHRVGPRVALDGGLLGGTKAVVGQIGGNYLAPLGQVRLAGLVSSTGAYGGLVQVSSSSSGPLGFTLDLRRIVARDGATIDGHPHSETALVSPLDGQPLSVRTSGGTFSQVSGYFGYAGRNRRFAISGSFRDEGKAPSTYSFGPSLRWDLVQRGAFRLSFDAEGAFTRRGRSGFVGLSLVRTGFLGTATSRIGVRHARQEGPDDRVVGSIAAATQIDDFGGGRVDLNGGFERQDGGSTLAASANLAMPQGTLRGDLVQRIGGGGGLQYVLGFNTLVGATRDKVAFHGANQSEGVMAIDVGGSRPSDRFEVIVDDAVVGVLRHGASFSVPLSAYREYKVRIRPVGSSALGYDSTTRQVSLYPGSVARLVWQVEPRIAAFGRLVLPDGRPARNAIVRNGQAVAQSDDQGYFQMEVAPQSQLEVILSDARRCRATIAGVSLEGEFASLDTVICLPRLGEPTTIAALDKTNGNK